MGHTYGTWLPGDPKGFRTRHHREHVEGDYKNPPPKGKYDKLWQRSKDLMKRDPVYLAPEQRARAVLEFVRSFNKWNIPLRSISIDRIHLHALVQVTDHNPRHYVGLAKNECSAYIKLDGLAPPGRALGGSLQVPPRRRSGALRQSHRLHPRPPAPRCGYPRIHRITRISSRDPFVAAGLIPCWIHPPPTDPPGASCGWQLPPDIAHYGTIGKRDPHPRPSALVRGSNG